MVNQYSAHSFAKNRQLPFLNQWEGENDPTKECCPSNFRIRDLLKFRKKKSACKINENGLKIAWKCTLRRSNFKNFPGEAPWTPFIRKEPPLILSPARGLRRSIHVFGSQCPPPTPPPPPVFRPSGSSPE